MHRQLKKMHRYWRGKLFTSTKNEVFQIHSADTTGLAELRSAPLRHTPPYIPAAHVRRFISCQRHLTLRAVSTDSA
jgi:hypothetical protein